MTCTNSIDASITTRPQPDSANTLIYREGIFIGRTTGQCVYGATGRLRSGDDFCRFIRVCVTYETRYASGQAPVLQDQQAARYRPTYLGTDR
jgi:cysteine synthase